MGQSVIYLHQNRQSGYVLSDMIETTSYDFMCHFCDIRLTNKNKFCTDLISKKLHNFPLKITESV